MQQRQKICPVCGGDNQCALAAGRATEACWCASASISPAVLAKIPDDAVGKRCLCPTCAVTRGDPLNER